ncbi:MULTISPECIES: anthranilate synthase component I family protein [unclassified Nocardioides]|uniref:anthranilate synthase component I family protein n=1 Tax=unclassified Nocardioides TaxID=2615069 RepID=UPI0009F0C55E|nr:MULTISPECIES: anthranilate synthase component I family protein [unclassified Nocardioides]GAW51938.1 anthranilate synthase component I/chorismate-binding protein [Nocardioides sp. PD653-B2]GAW56456.1 anthranilate synthase component I/chorismate-binding protein [Nocardioides sp. PD653]
MTDPVRFFRDVAARHARCFWLDGGGARAWSGRRSLVGWLEDDEVSLTYDAAARSVTRHVGGAAEVVGDDVFVVLEAELAAGDPGDQWFGYFGYACRPDLPALVGGGLPDAVWMRSRNVRFFDHAVDGQHRTPAGDVSLGDVRVPGPSGDSVPASYATAFTRVQEQLHAGNSYEVNLTYRMVAESDVDPVSAYLRLRELNPAPYAGFLQHDVPGAAAWLLSSSPERYALVTADRTLETKPIKGTTRRGRTPAEDDELRTTLATDPKTRAENLMIVDLLRNDLSMVCEPGTVTVPVLMDVESYETVHQLVSTVRGHLRADVTTVQALRALFPAGSMTGAPKLRTMEIVEDVEDTPRGPYAGAFGWISADGRADLGVVIRSLMTAGDGRYLIGTGGGITVRSDLADEYAESEVKAARVLQALGVAGPVSAS